MDLDLNPKPENPQQKKMIAMGIAIAAALAITTTLFTHRWLAAGGGLDAGFGLMSLKVCDPGGECQSQSNKELIDQYNATAGRFGRGDDKKGPGFWLAGYATLVTGALAVIFLFLALIAGCVFVATNPSRGTTLQLGVGWSFWVFGVGVVGGIVGAQLLAKFKPVEHDPYLQL